MEVVLRCENYVQVDALTVVDKVHVVKNCYTVCLLFNRWFTSVILNKSTVSGEEFPCADVCGESEDFSE